MTKKLGLALGSGGVRGLAHLGVFKALEDEGIKPSYITGSSIGALLGVMYAIHQDADKLLEIFTKSKWEVVNALIDPALRGGLVRGKKLEKLLGKWCDGSFEDLPIPVAVLAADLRTGKPVVLNKGKLIPAIMASMAVPGVFKPVKIGDMVLVDGGVCNPVPDDVARELGADVVVSVNLDNHNLYVEGTEDYRSMKGATIRSVNILRHYLALATLVDSDIVLEPYVKLRSIMDFGRYLAPNYDPNVVIKEGEKVTSKAMEAIRELLG